MEIISIERSTYEELLTSFNSFVAQMRAMADRGTDKKLGNWLDNQDVCQILNISPRTLQTLRQNGALAYSQIEHKVYYKPEDVERIIPLIDVRKKDVHSYRCHQRKGIQNNASCVSENRRNNRFLMRHDFPMPSAKFSFLCSPTKQS